MSNISGGPSKTVRPSSRSSRMQDPGNVRMKSNGGNLPYTSPPSQPPPPLAYRGNNGNNVNGNITGRRDSSYGPLPANSSSNYPHHMMVPSPVPPSIAPPSAPSYQHNPLDHPHHHPPPPFACPTDGTMMYGAVNPAPDCPPGFVPLSDQNGSQRWVPNSFSQRSFSEDYYNNNIPNAMGPNVLQGFPTGPSTQRPPYDPPQPYHKPSLQQLGDNHQRRMSSSTIQLDPPRNFSGSSPSPPPAFDAVCGRSLSGEASRQPPPMTRGRPFPQAFHTLYLRQISPPGVNRMGQLHSSQLHLEFLSHLQGVMQDIVPGSRFRLHGGMMSNVQIRACPIEVSWDLPSGHGNSDPLRALSNTLRRQQPTPLKYLFRCSTVPIPTLTLATASANTNTSSSSPQPPINFVSHLTVTDLISQLSCHITLNNNWAVFFSSIVQMYSSINPVIQIATQSILHWAVKSGINITPPPVGTSAPAADNRSRITSTDHQRGSLKVDASPPPSPTHTNLSVILILWIRFLIERYPEVSPSTDLIVNHLDLPTIDVSETVEEVLLRFFEFYRTVDFSTSVISIRSGAPSLSRFRCDQHPAAMPSSLVVIDPIIDRNLSGIWQPAQVASFVKELQITPWSSDALYQLQETSGRNSGDIGSTENGVGMLLQDPDLLSQWLAMLLDYPFVTAITQPYESFDEPAYQSSPCDLLFNGVGGMRKASSSVSASKFTNMCERESSEFPSRADLLADLNSMRLVQHILADKVRFLRNEIWWLERKAPLGSSSAGGATRRDRAESCVSLTSRRLLSTPEDDVHHWSCVHFGTSENSQKGIGLPTTVEQQETSQGLHHIGVPGHHTQVSTRSRLDTSSSGVVTNTGSAIGTASTTSAVPKHSFDFNKRGMPSSPLPDSCGVTTTTGSTPPPTNVDSPVEDHHNSDNNESNGGNDRNSIDNRLSDAVSMLLELTGYPRDLLSVGDCSPRSQQGKKFVRIDEEESGQPEMAQLGTQHTPSSEYLSALVEKHFGGNWNWERSTPHMQQLLQDILRDYSGTPLSLQVHWLRIDHSPFYTASPSSMNVTRIQESFIASFLPTGHAAEGFLPEVYECSSSLSTPFSLVAAMQGIDGNNPSRSSSSIKFSVSWNGTDSPRIGTLRSPSQLFANPIPNEIQFTDAQYADMSYCQNKKSPLLHFSLRLSDGSLSALDDEGNETQLLLRWDGEDVDETSNQCKVDGTLACSVPLIRTPTDVNRSKSEMIVIVWKKSENVGHNGGGMMSTLPPSKVP